MKKLSLVLAALLAACTITGCDAKAKVNAAAQKAGGAAAYGDASYDTGAVQEMAAAEASAEEIARVEEAAYSDTAAAASSVNAAADQAVSSDKLVYNCYISMQTQDYSGTMSSLKEKIAANGGFLEFESEQDNDNSWYTETYRNDAGSEQEKKSVMHASLTVRIPTKNYEAFLASLEGAGKIISKESNVENISRTYHDTEAVIQALEIQQKRLLEMMEKAETIEDMITVEARLTEVQTQLNQQKSNLSYMDSRVNYSTITLNIDEVSTYSRANTETVSFGERLAEAFRASFKNIGSFFQGLILVIAYFWPGILILVAAVIIIVKLVKRARKKKKEQPRMTQYPDPSMYYQTPPVNYMPPQTGQMPPQAEQMPPQTEQSPAEQNESEGSGNSQKDS